MERRRVRETTSWVWTFIIFQSRCATRSEKSAKIGTPSLMEGRAGTVHQTEKERIDEFSAD